MAVTRYSGSLVIRVSYLDGAEGATGYKCTVSRKGMHIGTAYPGEPRVRTISVDSPAAYDSAARSALSMLVDDGKDITEYADVDPTGAGWLISRKPPRAKANGRRRAPSIRQPTVFYNVIRAEGVPYDRVYIMHRVGDPTGATIRVPVVNGEPLVPQYLPPSDKGEILRPLPPSHMSAIMRAVYGYDDGDAKDNRRRSTQRSRCATPRSVTAKQNGKPVEYRVLTNRKTTTTVRGVRMHARKIIVQRKGSQVTYTLDADAYGRPIALPKLPRAHRVAILAALNARPSRR